MGEIRMVRRSLCCMRVSALFLLVLFLICIPAFAGAVQDCPDGLCYYGAPRPELNPYLQTKMDFLAGYRILQSAEPQPYGMPYLTESLPPAKKIEKTLLPLVFDSRPKPQQAAVRVIVEFSAGKVPLALQTLGSAGAAETSGLGIGNMFAATLSPQGMLSLAQTEGVEGIYPDREFSALLMDSVGQVKAQKAWELGYTGKGIKVAVVDTGIDKTNPMLSGRVVLEKDFTAENNPTDGQGHGTYIAGIIAGNKSSGGCFDGVAPDALLINAKALGSSGSGRESDIIRAIAWAADPDGNPETLDGANIINLSLGGLYSELDSPINRAVQAAANAGVLVVASAGNCSSQNPDASCNGFVGVTTPGNSPYALTVGAVDSENNYADFSSGQEIPFVGIKPDVVAPGVDVSSCLPGGQCAPSSGTSASAAHVSGIAALILEANPSYSPSALINLIETSALDLGLEGEDKWYGWGLADMERILSSDLFFDADFSAGIFSKSIIKTGINQPVSGELAINNSSEEDLVIKDIATDSWLLAYVDSNRVPAGGSAKLQYHFSPSDLGVGQFEGRIVLVLNDTEVVHTLYITVVNGEIKQEFDGNYSIEVAQVAYVWVNGIDWGGVEVFQGEEMEFKLRFRNITPPAKTYYSNVKILGPDGSSVNCDLAYDSFYIQQGGFNTLIFNHTLAGNIPLGRYALDIGVWHECSGQTQNGSCQSSSSYSCSDSTHTKSVDNAFSVVKYCDSGACCDTGTHKIRKSSYVCGSHVSTEYGCPDGTGNGSDIYVKYKDRYCDGTSEGCSGREEWTGWEFFRDCAAGSKCEAGNSQCVNNPVKCYSDGECGSSGYINSPVCIGNDVHQDYQRYYCINPGTAQSDCKSEVIGNKFKDSCAPGICRDGECTDNCSDQCSDEGKYYCGSDGLLKCARDGDADNCLEWKILSSCWGGKTCFVSSDGWQGDCVKVGGTPRIEIEGLSSNATVFKQPGDKVKVKVYTPSAQTLDFSYNAEQFALLSGPCINGLGDFPSGYSNCLFEVDENAWGGYYYFKVSNAEKREQSKQVRVFAQPSLIIVTSRSRLAQRVGDADSVISKALDLAARNSGVFYDLDEAEGLAGFPSGRGGQDPQAPSMEANDYALSVGQFLNDKCGEHCENVLILGDDSVVPHYVVDYKESHWLFGFLGLSDTSEKFFSDQPYIPRGTKNIGQIPEILADKNQVYIVKPDGKVGNEANDLAEAIRAKGNPVEILNSSEITCNRFPHNAEGTLILLGTRENNNAIKCVPWFDIGHKEGDNFDGSISIERNVWAPNRYAIVVSSAGEDDTKLSFSVQMFKDIIVNPKKYNAPVVNDNRTVYLNQHDYDSLPERVKNSNVDTVRGLATGQCNYDEDTELMSGCIITDFLLSIGPVTGSITDHRDMTVYCFGVGKDHDYDDVLFDALICGTSTLGAATSDLYVVGLAAGPMAAHVEGGILGLDTLFAGFKSVIKAAKSFSKSTKLFKAMEAAKLTKLDNLTRFLKLGDKGFIDLAAGAKAGKAGKLTGKSASAGMDLLKASTKYRKAADQIVEYFPETAISKVLFNGTVDEVEATVKGADSLVGETKIYKNFDEIAIADKEVKLLTTKGVGKNVLLDVTKDNTEKLGKYIDSAKKAFPDVADPLSDVAGEHQLIKGFNAKSVGTVVGDQTVSNFAVLKKGVEESWGDDHLFKYIRPGDATTRAQQVLKQFPSFKDREGIMRAINEVLETKDFFEPNKLRKEFLANDGKMHYLEVWMREGNPGQIGTIVPR